MGRKQCFNVVIIKSTANQPLKPTAVVGGQTGKLKFGIFELHSFEVQFNNLKLVAVLADAN